MKAIQTSVLFTQYKVSEELMLLIPDKVLVGEIDKDGNKFYDKLSSKVYFNLQYSGLKDDESVFFLPCPLEQIKDKYNGENYIKEYVEEVFSKAYYIPLKKEGTIQDDVELVIEDKKKFEKDTQIKIDYFITKDNKNKFKKEKIKEEDNSNFLDEIKDQIKNIDLNKNILFQEYPLEQLISTIYKNISIDNKEYKSNILLYGKSGVGKTAAINEIKKSLSLPVYTIDYEKERDNIDYNLIINLLYGLYVTSNFNMDLAQKGIIVIEGLDDNSCFDEEETLCFEDELDDLLHDLMPIFSKETVKVLLSTGNTLNFDTSSLTIILSGQFKSLQELDKTIEVPISSSCLDKKWNSYYTMYDVNECYPYNYNLFRNFDDIICFNDLTLENMKYILLNSINSPLNAYKKMFEKENIFLNELPDEVVSYICNKSYKNQNYCKGLKNEITNIFKSALPLVFHPESKNSFLEINKDIIKNPSNGFSLQKKK